MVLLIKAFARYILSEYKKQFIYILYAILRDFEIKNLYLLSQVLVIYTFNFITQSKSHLLNGNN